MKVVYQSHSVTNPFYCCHGGRNSCVQATLENVKRTENVEYQLQTATGIKCNHIFKILKERRETNGTLRIEFRIEKVSANFDSQPFVLLVTQPGDKRSHSVKLKPILVRSKPKRSVLVMLSAERRKKKTIFQENKRSLTKKRKSMDSVPETTETSYENTEAKRARSKLTEALIHMVDAIKDHRIVIRQIYAKNQELEKQMQKRDQTIESLQEEVNALKDKKTILPAKEQEYRRLFSWDELVGTTNNTMMNSIEA